MADGAADAWAAGIAAAEAGGADCEVALPAISPRRASPNPLMICVLMIFVPKVSIDINIISAATSPA